MRRIAMMVTAAALGLSVQLGGPVSAGSMEAEAEPTVVTGWWSPTAATVQLWGVVSVPVRVRTGTQFVVRQVQVQRRRSGTAAWLTVTSAVTAADGRYTARLFAPAGTWQFRLAVPASATGLAAETVPRWVTVLRAETISAGGAHTCALDATGKAWCWGSDEFGQLGNGSASQNNKRVPTAVVGGHTFATISAGWGHTCAVDAGGQAWCWGGDFWGTVGDGGANRADKYVPVPVAGGHRFATISADWHTCALDTTGKAWCWGPDGYGQGGDGTANQLPKHAPVAVVGSHTFKTVDAGYHHSCAIHSNGQVSCWGSDEFGQLGDGNDNEANEYSPVPVAGTRTFTHLVAALWHTCGVDGNGKAWCWGSDEREQLGDGADNDLHRAFAPAAVAGSHTFRNLSGGDHTCGVDTSNQAWCWGSDTSGQVGDGGDDSDLPQTVRIAVAGNHAVTTAAAGVNHSCAVATSGEAWCWGRNARGQAGAGTTTSFYYVPVAVAGGQRFRQPN